MCVDAQYPTSTATYTFAPFVGQVKMEKIEEDSLDTMACELRR